MMTSAIKKPVPYHAAPKLPVSVPLIILLVAVWALPEGLVYYLQLFSFSFLGALIL